jgi:hypothetical protein
VLDKWEVPSDIEDDVPPVDVPLEKRAVHPVPAPAPDVAMVEPPPARASGSAGDIGGLPAPPPEAAAAPRRARGAGGPRASAGERQFAWGPWTISEVWRDAEKIGFGANCLGHWDPNRKLRCTKPMTFGKDLTEDQVLAKLKLWLLQGLDISESATCRLPRTQHVIAIDARKLPVYTAHELDQMLRDRGQAP